MKAIIKKAKSLGYQVETRTASTGSLYITVTSEKREAIFRVSNHAECYPSPRNTLQIDIYSQGLEYALSILENLDNTYKTTIPLDKIDKELIALEKSINPHTTHEKAFKAKWQALQIPDNLKEDFKATSTRAKAIEIATFLNLGAGLVYAPLTKGKRI